MNFSSRLRSRAARIAVLFAAFGALAGWALPSTAGASAHHPPSHPAAAHASMINGYQPGAGQWPWMVAITWDGHLCSGSVVAPTRVLTAGHCAYGVNPAEYVVTVGRRERNNPSSGEEVGVTAAYVDPEYDPANTSSDVAVLVLAHPVSVQPATLGEPTDWGAQLSVLGWGTTDPEGETGSDTLAGVDLATRSDAECGGIFGSLYQPLVELCAGGDGVHSICHGDSGAPAMASYDGGQTWRIIGTTSYHVGSSCLDNGGTAVFAWVAGPTLRPWVAEAIAGVPARYAVPGTTTTPAPPAAQPAPAAAVVTNKLAAEFLRQMIERKTAHRAHHLKLACRSAGPNARSCSAHFNVEGAWFAGNYSLKAAGSGSTMTFSEQFRGRSGSGRRVLWH